MWGMMCKILVHFTINTIHSIDRIRFSRGCVPEKPPNFYVFFKYGSNTTVRVSAVKSFLLLAATTMSTHNTTSHTQHGDSHTTSYTWMYTSSVMHWKLGSSNSFIKSGMRFMLYNNIIMIILLWSDFRIRSKFGSIKIKINIRLVLCCWSTISPPDLFDSFSNPPCIVLFLIMELQVWTKLWKIIQLFLFIISFMNDLNKTFEEMFLQY